MEENTMKAEAKHLKLVKWYEAGFPPIDLNANVSGVVAVIAEYKRLAAEIERKDTTIQKLKNSLKRSSRI